MARVKRGVTAHARHKKVIKQAKGYRGRRKNTFKVAKQAVEKSLQYAYRDRRAKKRDEGSNNNRASKPIAKKTAEEPHMRLSPKSQQRSKHTNKRTHSATATAHQTGDPHASGPKYETAIAVHR